MGASIYAVPGSLPFVILSANNFVILTTSCHLSNNFYYQHFVYNTKSYDFVYIHFMSNGGEPLRSYDYFLNWSLISLFFCEHCCRWIHNVAAVSFERISKKWYLCIVTKVLDFFNKENWVLREWNVEKTKTAGETPDNCFQTKALIIIKQ